MSCAAHRGNFPPWTGTVTASLDDRKYSIAKAALNAGELAEKLLTYFDRYQLGSVAPIVVELEKALAAEYCRGLEEAGCWRESYWRYSVV